MNLTSVISFQRVRAIAFTYIFFSASLVFGQFPPPPGGGPLPPTTINNPGDNDDLFNPFDRGLGQADQFNGGINALVVQPDGKILIGTSSGRYNGVQTPDLTRLNPDGSLDAAFNDNLNRNRFSRVNGIHLLPDGKILVSGLSSIRKYNSDGTVDTDFNASVRGQVDAFDVQDDGKIVVLGRFSMVGDVALGGIARLNTDGSLDPTFDPGLGLDRTTSIVLSNDVIIQDDGKIIASGFFNLYDGQPNNGLIRILPTGEIDPDFDIGAGFGSGAVRKMLSLNGDVYFAGSFGRYNSTTALRVARFDANGLLDQDFQTAINALNLNSLVFEIAEDANGQLLLGGSFDKRIIRLNPDGTEDLSFDVGFGVNSAVAGGSVGDIGFNPAGEIIIGGLFSNVDRQPRNNIAKLGPNGALTGLFRPNFGFTGNLVRPLTMVNTDGGTLTVGGSFSGYNGTFANNIVRISSSGGIDPSFQTGSGFSGLVNVMLETTNQDLLVGGSFREYNSSETLGLVKLDGDGVLDLSFTDNLRGDFRTIDPTDMVLLPDGGILALGFITFVAPIEIEGQSFFSFSGMVKVTDDGMLDLSFSPLVLNSTNGELLYVSKDEIYIGGLFTVANQTSRNRLLRVSAAGVIDESFDIGTGFDRDVRTVNSIGNQILIGGTFLNYNGLAASGLALLNSDGSLDSDFQSKLPTTLSNITAVHVDQSRKKILVGGGFRDRIVRLNLDGTQDETFSGSANGVPSVIVPQASMPDKVYIGGEFTSYNDTGRNRIARIFNTASPRVLLSPNRISNFFTSPSSASASQQLTITGNDLNEDVRLSDFSGAFEFSTDDVNFSSPITLPMDGGNLAGEPVTLFARLRAGLSPADYLALVIIQSAGISPAILTLSGEVECPTITFDVSSNNASCPGSSDAAITFTEVSGANRSLWILHSMVVVTFQEDSSFQGLAAGNYFLSREG